jgi:hypothetical protein
MRLNVVVRIVCVVAAAFAGCSRAVDDDGDGAAGKGGAGATSGQGQGGKASRAGATNGGTKPNVANGTGGIGAEGPSEVDEAGGQGGEAGGGSAGAEPGPVGLAPDYPCVVGFPWPTPPSLKLPNPQAYDTSEEGVVLDEVTGLMWERETAEFPDSKTAAAHCSALDAHGHDDWRLPELIELASLVDVTKQPTLDTDVFGEPPFDVFWSNTVYDDDPNFHWKLTFYDGRMNDAIATLGDPVLGRCVRTARLVTEAPAECHVISDEMVTGDIFDQTLHPLIVKNVVSGLTWLRPSLNRSYDDIVQYCKTATEDGGGWRIPTIAEIATIIDYSTHEWSFYETGSFTSFNPDPMATSALSLSMMYGTSYYTKKNVNSTLCVR